MAKKPKNSARSRKMKLKKLADKVRIEDVQVGLDNAGKYAYEDTGETVEDGDQAYVVIIPTAIDEDSIYFTDEAAAKQYIIDNGLDEE